MRRIDHHLYSSWLVGCIGPDQSIGWFDWHEAAVICPAPNLPLVSPCVRGGACDPLLPVATGKNRSVTAVAGDECALG